MRDWRGASIQSPIPAQQRWSHEEGCQGHRPQEDAEGKRMVAIHELSRLPSSLACHFTRFVALSHPAFRAPSPDGDDGSKAEQGTYQRSAEDGQHRETHTEEGSDHGHQFDVSKAHALAA